MDDLLHQCFRPATDDDSSEAVLYLSAADIFKALKKQNPTAMRRVNPNAFSQILSSAVFLRRHGHYGNFYPVISLQKEILSLSVSDE